MLKNVAKRHPAREEQNTATPPQRRPGWRSAFQLHHRVGAYIVFIVAGVALVTAAAFWQMLATDDVAATSQVILDSSIPDALFPELPLSVPEESPEALPIQEGGAAQRSAQQLISGIETAAPAPTSSAGTIAPRSILTEVNITFYDCADQGFCGAMYNGKKVHEGVAACSWNLPLGTRFVIVGDPTHRIYICEDRGILPDTWVDIFWYFPNQGQSWQSIVGRHGIIEIVSVP